jgi:hypothetical protein
MLIFNYLTESELLVKETESAVPEGVRDDELLPLFVLLHMCHYNFIGFAPPQN